MFVIVISDMIEQISIQETAILLGYKDIRSAKRWCNNNGVKILSDFGSKKQYVIKEEFEEAKIRRAKIYLTQKYGDDKLSEAKTKQGRERIYSLSGDNEKRFLNSLTENIHLL